MENPDGFLCMVMFVDLYLERKVGTYPDLGKITSCTELSTVTRKTLYDGRPTSPFSEGRENKLTIFEDLKAEMHELHRGEALCSLSHWKSRVRGTNICSMWIKIHVTALALRGSSPNTTSLSPPTIPFFSFFMFFRCISFSTVLSQLKGISVNNSKLILMWFDHLNKLTKSREYELMKCNWINLSITYSLKNI